MPVTTLVKQKCAGCLTPIRDRYMLKVMNKPWHESCLHCQLCRLPLTTSCFSCGGKFYCKHDYEKLCAPRCAGCHLTIPPHELVMKVDHNHSFHLPCFSCVVCRRLLQKGQQFVFKDAQVFCRQHYQTEFTFFPINPKIGDTSECCHVDAVNEEVDSTKDHKRPRTILTTSQRQRFNVSFETNPKPCRKVRESLAAETGLAVRVVQVWFQNQRAKVKKLERKQNMQNKNTNHNRRNKNNNQKGKSCPGRNSNQTSMFERNEQEQDSLFSDYGAEKHREDGSLITSPYISGLQNRFTDNFHISNTSSQGGTHIFTDPSSPDTSNSFYLGTPLDIKDGIDHLDLVPRSNNRKQQCSKVVTSNLTPIDKLYSMQMSYFCSD